MAKNKNSEQEYKELKELLIEASRSYYQDSVSIMSDYEFDMKMKKLEEMEERQGYKDQDTPTVRPGSDLSTQNPENTHGRPMLSLENTYNFEEIDKWYEDMKKATGLENPEVVVNPKWDGGSGAIRYDRSGNVYKALTRGDGEVGEDITQNINYCNANLWPAKRLYGMPFTGEVRGELIMTNSGFNELNKESKYQNARNLLSGSLKLLELNDFVERAPHIKFFAYWLEDSENKKYSEDLGLLKMYGFEVGDYYICKNIDEIKDAINKIETTKFDVLIDGAVMKLNEKKFWGAIGSTSRAPRWARAFKYKQPSIETTIKKVEFWVGRTGKVTPVAWFEPVTLDGSLIQKATLNNKEFYYKMDVAPGDIVEVQKAAAIIPQIINVVKRHPGRKVTWFPVNCPCCGQTLRKHKQEHNDYYCDNQYCKSRIVDQIINYTHSVECDGFAEVITERLCDAGLLTSIADLYKLKDRKEDMAKLPRLSLGVADTLCQNIENAKNADFWKVLAGLGIPNVGPKTAKTLAKKFKTIKILESATQVELEETEDIAEITAKGIIQWFRDNHDLIRKLEEVGVNLSIEIRDEDDKPEIDLTGKTFCITGALSLTRDIYTEIIEACGGKVVSSVSSKTSYLITNDKTTGTTKNKKAQELGIPILNEKELLEMCDALHLLKEIGGV